MSMSTFWLCLGFTGQGLFASRFLVQWVASERRRRSHIPIYFWYLSIAGGLLSLIYAIYLQDPPFIFGQSAGIVVYSRNLILLKRDPRAGDPSRGTV